MLFVTSQMHFSFLRYLNFCPYFFGCVGKHLDKKVGLILKFMTSQTGKQTITIPILTNISRNKGNHTTKLGQFM